MIDERRLASLEREVEKLRERYHNLVGPVQTVIDMGERVERLEALPMTVARLEIIVNRLEKAIWAACGLVLLTIGAEILQVVLHRGTV